jgi:hypothetical protein
MGTGLNLFYFRVYLSKNFGILFLLMSFPSLSMRAFSLSGLLFAAIFNLSFADTVLLKTGEEISGSIVEETETTVVIDVQAARGITDQRTLSKEEIQTISRKTAADADYEELQKFKLGINSYPQATYEGAIASMEYYIKTHQDSPNAAAVQGTLAGFREELEKVQNGSVKYNNRWYTPAELELEKTQLAGQALLASIADLAARGDTIGALNTFDRLERNYPVTRAYVDSVKVAIALASRLPSEIERAVVNTKAQEVQFKNSVVLLAEPAKSQALAAWQQKIAQAEQVVLTAERAGVKWKPIVPLSERSINALKSLVPSEITRLSKVPVVAMKSSIGLAEDAEVALKSRDLEKAEAKIKEATTLWARNELLTRLMPALDNLKEQAKATPEPTPSITPTPSKPTGAK